MLDFLFFELFERIGLVAVAFGFLDQAVGTVGVGLSPMAAAAALLVVERTGVVVGAYAADCLTHDPVQEVATACAAVDLAHATVVAPFLVAVV